MTSIERANAENNILDKNAIFTCISGRGPMLDFPASWYGKAIESEAVALFVGS